MHNAITDVAGLRAGHYTDRAAGTGCTVLLCEEGAVAALDIRGAAPGTRESDVLRPGNLVRQIHAVLLTGGSAFGLDAAAGIMAYLAERGRGFRAGRGTLVPIVPAAVLFDLGIGDHHAFPHAEDARYACQQAGDGPVDEGSVGAGTGATIGKLFGAGYVMKGGLGTASERLPNGAVVGALVAVNAVGDVIDAEGRIVAGAWARGQGFLDSARQMRQGLGPDSAGLAGTNTTLAIVATDAPLDSAEAHRFAAMAHNGIVRAVRPANTMYDGDLVFALSTARGLATDINVLGEVAAETLARAVVSAVTKAEGLFRIPAVRDLKVT